MDVAIPGYTSNSEDRRWLRTQRARARRTGRPRPLRLLLAAVLALPLVVMARRAPAAATVLTFSVTSTADSHDAHPGDGVCADAAGQCTLRAAVEEANAQPAGSALRVTVPAGTYGLTRGTLQLTATTLTLTGAPSSTTIISGNKTSTVLAISSTVRATLSQVTLTGGGNKGSGHGSGIYNAGTLTLTNSTVSGNVGGGGIYNTGTMRVTYSTVSGNAARAPHLFLAGRGGGIYNTGVMIVTNSTVSGNAALTVGGGIYNAGAMRITNSTVSGNAALGAGNGTRGRGGGIYNGGTMTLAYSTVSDNYVDLYGVGIDGGGPLTLRGTILRNGGPGGNCTLGVVVTDQGYNLDSDRSCRLTQPTDINNRDPRLGSLAHNGGPTQTIALQAGSPASGHGGTRASGCPATDQRGSGRPDPEDGAFGRCDIGAFEAALPSSGMVAADRFQRSVSQGWGNADVGGLYTLYTGNSSVANFAVTGGTGAMILTTPGANRAAFLLGISTRDVDERVCVAFDKPATGSGADAYLLARHLNDGSEYRGKLHVLPSGMVTVQATRVLATVEDNLGTDVSVPGLTVTPGQCVWVRLEVTGSSTTTLQMKAWADGQPEPAFWLFRTTITEPRLQGTGAVGMRAYLAGAATNAPVTARFADFQALQGILLDS